MVYSFGTVMVLSLLLYGVLDVSLTDGERIRSLPKALWVTLVLLLPGLGTVLWLLLGRPSKGVGRGGSRAAASGTAPGAGPGQALGPGPDTDRAGSGHARPPRTDEGGPHGSSRPGPGRPGPGPLRPGGRTRRSAAKGPDDDPDFLRHLEEQLRRRDDGT
jgi:hypothetical protein